MEDFLFRGHLAEYDPDVAALIDLEAVRQARKLIMIPSESTVPFAVREALSSVFHNLYAEGYPPEHWRNKSIEELMDVDMRLADLRRNGGARYYQGAEIVDILESLARRRTAERLANERVSADQLYVNVQPLSGAPANSAVYTALINVGDTILGMDLLHGGHLTHGSPVARSGIQYNAVGYGVHPETERLDYDHILALAKEHQPKIIVGGYTSYPWAPDWEKLREIADEVGAYLLADVSHIAGLIIAGVFPSPVGIADVTMFTTHKTLAGPRGAVLVTHKASIARKLDRGVFPGEQGGPHVNAIAGLAVAMKLAESPKFVALQQQIVYNAKRLAQKLAERGLRIPYGGTDSHMLLVDVGSIKGADGTPFSGDMAARILDIAGIVANRNTIPGDKSPFKATGVRFGTPWITQRGFREPEIDRLADAIADLLLSAIPFGYAKSYKGKDWRAKVDTHVLFDVQQRVRQLANEAGIDYEVPTLAGYYRMSDAAAEHFRVIPDDEPSEKWHTIEIKGKNALRFLETVTTNDVLVLGYGEWQPTWVLQPDGQVLSQAVLERLTEDVYLLHVARNVDAVAQWLTSFSDGYVQIDPHDVFAKVPGPVSVSVLPHAVAVHRFEGLEIAPSPNNGYGINRHKGYFVGCYGEHLVVDGLEPKPLFSWQEPTRNELLKTHLYDLHKSLGAKMVEFAGYDMPVWYSSVSEEHLAVRTHAGIFDVTHMGVFEVSGLGAESFLDILTTNDVAKLKPGKAHYSYLLGVDGLPLDDIFIYRLADDRFMVVVNASNNDKNWAWLNAVRNGEVCIDERRPWAEAVGREHVNLRDLRAPESGADQRVDLALQGPASRDILLSLPMSKEDAAAIKNLAWSSIVSATIDGFDVYISRTGYTGERIAYEIFVHPEQASALFKRLVDAGVVPCGLAARDSLRIEAGLPLYGHELAGPYNMNPADAGFASYVKLWKPFFVGKAAYIAHEAERDQVCTRFRIDQKGGRPAHVGDPIVDRRGRVIGVVTSCSRDTEGYQTGQALLKLEFAQPDTQVMIYSNAARALQGKALADLSIGDRTVVPELATILTRFPKS
ncbi:MAG: glycine cleavage system protein T [Phototrophicales bacterium]|nr:MAG: glycine cleavage system protein T [Phototrophicales bacterium]